MHAHAEQFHNDNFSDVLELFAYDDRTQQQERQERFDELLDGLHADNDSEVPNELQRQRTELLTERTAKQATLATQVLKLKKAGKTWKEVATALTAADVDAATIATAHEAWHGKMELVASVPPSVRGGQALYTREMERAGAEVDSESRGLLGKIFETIKNLGGKVLSAVTSTVGSLLSTVGSFAMRHKVLLLLAILLGAAYLTPQVMSLLASGHLSWLSGTLAKLGVPLSELPLMDPSKLSPLGGGFF